MFAKSTPIKAGLLRAAVALAPLIFLAVSAPRSDSQPVSAAQQAVDLTQQPAFAPPVLEPVTFEGKVAALHAAAIIETVPRPPGAQRAASLNWEAQGPLTDNDIKSLVLFNTACDWWQHALTQGDQLADDERTILTAIPDWPNLRQGSFAEGLRTATIAFLAGDVSGLQAVADANCRRH